jgi:hypothetical protein
MEHGTTILSAAYGLSTLVSIAIQIALLVVTLTTVRKNKPRAVAPLAASFGIGIASTAASIVVYPLMSLLLRDSGGMDRYLVVQSATTVGFSLIHVVSGVLLVLGLVKLATPDAEPAGR